MSWRLTKLGVIYRAIYRLNAAVLLPGGNFVRFSTKCNARTSFGKYARGNRMEIGTLSIKQAQHQNSSSHRRTNEESSPPCVRDSETKNLALSPEKHGYFFPSKPGRLNI